MDKFISDYALLPSIEASECSVNVCDPHCLY